MATILALFITWLICFLLILGHGKKKSLQVITFFTLYRNPPGYPGKLVLIKWTLAGKGDPVPDEEPALVTEETDFKGVGEYAITDQGYTLYIERDKDDDPVILGSFIKKPK